MRCRVDRDQFVSTAARSISLIQNQDFDRTVRFLVAMVEAVQRCDVSSSTAELLLGRVGRTWKNFKTMIRTIDRISLPEPADAG